MEAAQVHDRKVFRAGHRIFSEGSNGNCAYVVQSGAVEISKDIGGDKVVLGRVGPGGIFGEMALIDSQPRMATATAVEGTVCVVVSDIAFQERLRRTDPFVRGLLKILVGHARRNATERARAA